MMAHAITSRLPVEIVDHIFSELDTARHTELYRLLLVNSHFHALSIRLLYRNLRPWTPPRTVRLLQFLVFSYLQDRPSRCPPPHNFVKSLHIHLGNITTLKALTTLIYRALRTLPQLKSLVLDLSAKDNGYAWVLPPDVPFRLETFTTTLHFVPALADFLNGQPTIRHLSLRGCQTIFPFKLAPGALPQLSTCRTVHASPGLLVELTKGRPLTGLSLSIFPEDYCYSFKAATRTSAPIKRLTVLILGSIPPSELFLNIAKYMPLLEALHVVSPFGMDSSDALQASAPSLEDFKALRYITYMASGESEGGPDEASLAECWHEACPTLQTIILPKGQLWFRRGEKWVCSLVPSPSPEVDDTTEREVAGEDEHEATGDSGATSSESGDQEEDTGELQPEFYDHVESFEPVL